jgi:hypothetical protein
MQSMSTTRLTRALASGAIVAALAVSALLPGLAYAAKPPPPPAVPDPNLVVTDGSVPFLLGHATGTQNYTCQLVNGVFAWTFVAPAATLVDDSGKVIATHYAGPTWQAVPDGSTVVGSKQYGATVDPTAIQWLRLSAKSTSLGPDGGDRLVATTDIQRVNTTGGLAPTSGCDATTLGNEQDVPYTADYYFYHMPD